MSSEGWFFQESKSVGPTEKTEIQIPPGMRHAVAPGQETAVYEGPLYIYAAWDSPGLMRASDRCEDCRAFVEAHP